MKAFVVNVRRYSPDWFDPAQIRKPWMAYAPGRQPATFYTWAAAYQTARLWATYGTE